MRAAALSLVVFAAVANAGPLDPKQSELVVLAWKRGTAQAVAHDHVIRAASVSGSLAPTGEASITVDARALVADEDDTRARYRVGAKISPDDARQVEVSMKGPDQLDVEQFPTIRFESAGGTFTPTGEGTVQGKFTLHGVTRAVECKATLKRTETSLEVTARLRLKVSDYGIKPYSAMFGLIGVRDEVELVVRLVATP